ncbi:hypothetical protein [Arthrobacter mobilis]|uniref:Uncharacterized protein n=1 Tax=Arthrobacter mobilis TaxID=2724944 RepID=A0A7X6K539_9MICC|nr:hypothetical protein [Arthrobacter mobilis]NKX55300.1 hypothetical protein [Arthrobacter mobilis]
MTTAIAAPAKEWAALFSSYSPVTGEPVPHATLADAYAHAAEVTAAQPGIEFELVSREGTGPWPHRPDGSLLELEWPDNASEPLTHRHSTLPEAIPQSWCTLRRGAKA